MLEQNNIIKEINEDKARFLVKYLLENDSMSNKKLIPEIELLNYNDFYNLFKGIKYQKDDLYKHDFEDLVMKFNNFSKIINKYYEDPKYYSALLDLWTNNVCIEDLKQYAEKSEKFIEKIKLLTDKYEEWPSDFQKDFYKLVKGTTNTKMYELKKTFEEKYNAYYELTKELINLKRNFEYNPEDKYIAECSDKIIGGIIAQIGINYIFSKYSNYIFNKIKTAKGLLNKASILSDIKYQIDDYGDYGVKCSPMQIFNDLKNLMENDVGKKKYILEFKDNLFQWVSSDKSESQILCSKLNVMNLDLDVDTLDGNFICEDPSICDELEYMLKDDLSSFATLIGSFLNLGWSIYNFREIDKEFKKLDIYDKKLEEIRVQFYNHKNLLKDLPNSLKEAIAYIKHILSLITDDQKELDNLINNIMESIRKQKDMQNKSKTGMIFSALFGTWTIGKLLLSGGGIVNMVSLGFNAFSGVTHYANYEKSEDLIKKFQIRLEKAIKLNNEINEFIDKLVNALEKRKKKEIPKFLEFEVLEKKLNEEKKEKPKTIKLDINEKNDNEKNENKIIDNYF